MPRKAKEKIEEVTEKIDNIELNSKKSVTKNSNSSNKKKVSKKETENSKIEKTSSSKSTANSTKKKTNTTKASTSKTTTKKSSSKASTSKVEKTKTAKKATTKKSSTSTTRKRKSTTKKKVEVLEYYDLPYRYNQTVVKILAQTPTTLFVYWDISDEDKNQYIKQYGEYFFHNTKPVLIVYNKTKHYHFEVDINDFANSWYLSISDSKCDYQIELGRRPINEYVQLSNNYMYITASNHIESPNDHILFDELSHFVYFRNVKTNQTTQKSIANLSFLSKIGKVHSIQEFYQALYPEESIHFNQLDLKNPSSGNPSSSFQ